jgi:hypothetical protein
MCTYVNGLTYQPFLEFPVVRSDMDCKTRWPGKRSSGGLGLRLGCERPELEYNLNLNVNLNANHA